MSTKRKPMTDADGKAWAGRLMKSVRAVLAAHPNANPDNVRHTLILTRYSPLERLRKSLTRGRALAQRK